MPAKSATRTPKSPRRASTSARRALQSSGRRSARKPSRTAATSSSRRSTHARVVAPSTGLPGWNDLGASDNGTARKANKRKRRGPSTRRQSRLRVLDVAPSLRFAVWTLIACIAVTLYVGHVYATQSTLANLQSERRENLRLRLTQDRLRGAFDRMTGPRQVMDQAAALGLEEGAAYGPVITVSN